MKNKILIILSILFLSLSTLTAQDMDMETILAMLEDDAALEAQDITAFTTLLNDGTLLDDGSGLTVGEALLESITTQIEELVADGTITSEQAASTLAVVTEIEDGTATTLGGALTNAGTSLSTIQDSLAESIALMASEQLFSDPTAKQDLIDGLNLFKGVLETLTKFGQANAQTSSASSLFAHQGYKLIAASVGITGSFATDMDSLNTAIELTSSENAEELLAQQLEDAGFKAGISMQAISASVGINLSWLVDRLYAGIVFGSTNVTVSSSGLDVNLFDSSVYNTSLGLEALDEYGLEGSVDTNIIGITANYQLIKPVGIPVLFRWNGLSFGTGLISSGFTVDLQADLGKMLMSMSGDDSESITIPDEAFLANFTIDSNAITIPLELSTGIRVLSIVNIGVGVGADLKFGSSDITFDLETSSEETIGTKIISALLDNLFQEADMDFPYNNPTDVELVNLKAMASVGIGLGPVSIDFSAIGYSSLDQEDIGFTLGANVVLSL